MSLGLGVMLNRMTASDVPAIHIDRIGRRIQSLELKNDRLYFRFADGKVMTLFDGGQSCCEVRYMTIDDDLAPFFDSTFQGFVEKEVKTVPCEHDEMREVVFVEVKTSKGSFDICSHNEHNGYYGGFALKLTLTGNN